MQILKADMHMYIWLSHSLERSVWVWILLWVLMFNPASKGLWVGIVMLLYGYQVDWKWVFLNLSDYSFEPGDVQELIGTH